MESSHRTRMGCSVSFDRDATESERKKLVERRNRRKVGLLQGATEDPASNRRGRCNRGRISFLDPGCGLDGSQAKNPPSGSRVPHPPLACKAGRFFVPSDLRSAAAHWARPAPPRPSPPLPQNALRLARLAESPRRTSTWPATAFRQPGPRTPRHLCLPVASRCFQKLYKSATPDAALILSPHFPQPPPPPKPDAPRRSRRDPAPTLPAAEMVKIEEIDEEVAVGEIVGGRTGKAVGAGSVGSHVESTAGPSSSTRPTYLQVLLTGLVLANSVASKGSAVFDHTQTTPSTCINGHVLHYAEAVEEEPEMEGPVAADANIILPVPVVPAHADEAELVDHDEVRVNENAVPWLPIAGSRRKVRKWHQARKGGMVMTNEGLGYFVYGTYGPNGLEF